MMPSYFYISKLSQAAVFSLSGSGLCGTELRARTFQMRTSQQLCGVGSPTVPVTGSLDQSQSHSLENRRLKSCCIYSGCGSPKRSGPFSTGSALEHLIGGIKTLMRKLFQLNAENDGWHQHLCENKWETLWQSLHPFIASKSWKYWQTAECKLTLYKTSHKWLHFPLSCCLLFLASEWVVLKQWQETC